MNLDLTTPTVAQLTKPHDKFGISLVRITTAMARELIDKDHLATNRPIAKSRVESYSRDMRGGRWNGLNGEGLKFNTEGKLIDGEHRIRGLAGIEDIEFGIDLIVYQGVDDAARRTMDDPRPRNAADELNMSGGAGTLGTKLASALRAMAIIGAGGGAGGRMSKAELLHLSELHPKMIDSVKVVMGSGDKEDKVLIRPAVVTAMHYIAAVLLKEKDRASAMVSVLRTGEKDDKYGKDQRDPMHAWVVYAQKNGTTAEAELIRGTIRAWELFAKGEPLAGNFSIPKQQGLVTGLGVPKVFGDMLDLAARANPPPKGPPVAAPKPPKKAAKVAADKPAKAPKKAAGSTQPPMVKKDSATPPATDTPPADAKPGSNGNATGGVSPEFKQQVDALAAAATGKAKTQTTTEANTTDAVH